MSYNLKPIVSLLIAFCVSLTILHLASKQKTDFENLAKGKENTSRRESYKGEYFSAFTIDDINTIIFNSVIKKYDNYCKKDYRIIWFGNSQLHYINQYAEGDHLSPYWLKINWQSPECIDPLGFSLPNANLQEFYILSDYVANTLPLDGLILELVFDDLREDNLRADFSIILSELIVEKIRSRAQTGEKIIDKFISIVKGQSKDILAGTIQKPVESWLTEKLGKVSSIWANRSKTEGNILLGLYNLRNWVFRIKPTTTRKMIKARYELNMEALDAMLSDYQKRDIPVLLYIAPIRQDKPLPYELTEYSTWKEQVKMLADKYHATMVNLETHIPPHYWGSYVGEEIDFMHFQGPGHKIVAEALLPHVKEMLKRDGKD